MLAALAALAAAAELRAPAQVQAVLRMQVKKEGGHCVENTFSQCTVFSFRRSAIHAPPRAMSCTACCVRLRCGRGT